MFLPSAQAFEVHPAIQEVSVEAGSSTERVLFVKNTEKSPIDLFLRAQTFVAGANGVPRFLDPSLTRGLPEWIGVSVPEFRLAPGEERAIRVRISPPKGTASGGAYAGIFVAEKPAIHGAVDISRRIATLWLVTVKGDVPAKALFEMDVDWGERASWFGRSHAVRVSVKNAGTLHGTIRVKTSFDGEREMRLLPQETREEYFLQKRTFPSLFTKRTVELFLTGDVHPQKSVMQQMVDWRVIFGYVAAGGGITMFLWWIKRARRR